MNKIEYAEKYIAEYGLNVLPTVINEKRPAGNWTEYQKRLITINEFKAKYGDHSDADGINLGVVCGKISGNLEVVDFDNHFGDAEAVFQEYLSAQDIKDILNRCVIERTPGGGYHVFYRCEQIEGNVKLAEYPIANPEPKKAKQDTVIETRGEGGFCVCAPSEGYELIQGSFAQIPEITTDEREILLNTARQFNKVEQKVKARFKKDRAFSGKPWELYDQSEQGLLECKSLLIDNGWTHLYDRNELEYWCRPGKTDGVSATFTGNQFRVYTTNGAPFEAKYFYVPSVIYTLLKYGSDSEHFKQATLDFVSKGFGERITKSSGTDIQQIENYLDEHYEFKINSVTGKLEMKRKHDLVFHEAEDYDISSIYRELQHKDFAFSYDRLNNLLNSNFVPLYDPFVKYFEELEVWDGQDYIKDLCNTITLQDETKRDFFYMSMRRFLIAMVGCAMERSITNEVSIIFHGGQGQGKTKWFKKLIPESLNPEKYLFTGSINDDKDSKINLATKLLINLDELQNLNREELGYLKSYFSLDSISLREPYMRKSKTYTRRASFVGSIDREEFLSDLAGTRRFLVFTVSDINYTHAIDMNKVFSQAYALFKAGEKFYFSPDEISLIENNNENYKTGSYEEGLLLQHFMHPSYKAAEIPLTTTEIAQEFQSHDKGYKVTDASLKKLGQIMTKLGFEKRNIKRSGVSQKCWLVERTNLLSAVRQSITDDYFFEAA